MADKSRNVGFPQHVIQRAAVEDLLKCGAAVTAHQHQINFALLGSLLEIVHGAVFADDVLRLHFVDIKIFTYMLLRIRFYFGSIPRGEH